MAERTDNIGFGGIKLLQDSDEFCYGVDAVLLADFSKAAAGDCVIDIGCGSGAVSFICMAKYAPKSITGIDIRRQAVELACRSLELNRDKAERGIYPERMSFRVMDILDAPKNYGKASFSLALCNPPYFEKGANIASSDDGPALARHESTASLKDIFEAASALLAQRGRLCMIHRPSRLGDLMEFPRSFGLEPKTLRMVCPRPGEAPNLVLMEYVKGAGKELKILPELCVRDSSVVYSAELNKIYER